MRRCSTSQEGMSCTGPPVFSVGKSETARPTSASTTRKPLSTPCSSPGKAERTQFSRVGSAVTFSSALSKQRVDEVALKLGNCQSPSLEIVKSSQSLSGCSTTLENHESSEPLSPASMSSGEGGVGDKLEQMGISSLVIAATLSRLIPGASVKDALNALCTEPETTLDRLKDFWECPICFERQGTYGWQCPEGHRFCRSCMRHHVKAVAFPRCPHLRCGYELNVADLGLLKMSRKRVDDFEHGKLQTTIETLGWDSSTGTCKEQVVHCREDSCSNVMLVPLSDCRECFACPCGAPSFCTKCGETPYHVHADCKQVSELRQAWFNWVGEARNFRKKQADAFAELQKRMKACAIFNRDELWKLQNCRLCPRCNRVVEKIDGCNAMRCGEDTHGGNRQQGCGARFDWAEAALYAPQLSSVKPPKPRPAGEGKGIYHRGIFCKVCARTIFGPRLRCIHCESFNVCADCEAGLDSHDLSHVFEVINTSDFDWTTCCLPPGVTVRFVRSGCRLPPSWHGHQFEGKTGTITGVAESGKNLRLRGISDIDREIESSGITYQVSVPGHRGSDPEMPASYVVPVFESRWQAGKVAAKKWKQGMREPEPAPDDIDHGAFYAAVVEHGPLQACQMMNQGAFNRHRNHLY